MTNVFPSGEEASDSTLLVWPLNVLIKLPVFTSQSLINVSLPPLAKVFPSGEKATESTSVVCRCRTITVFFSTTPRRAHRPVHADAGKRLLVGRERSGTHDVGVLFQRAEHFTRAIPQYDRRVLSRTS